MSSGFYANNCIVCGKDEKIKRGLRLFRFPSDYERCRTWIKFIGRKELVYMTIDDLREQSVCDAHFPPQCTNSKGNRLHQIALPTIEPAGPPLSDALVAAWPKKRLPQSAVPVMLNRASAQQEDHATAKSPTYISPAIDYELPLMNCIETLRHNKTHVVRKPAGILNSISVPLMAYSSSLERGTIFAADEPKDLYKLNLTPKIEPDDVAVDLQPSNIDMSSEANTNDTSIPNIANKVYQNKPINKLIKPLPARDLAYQRFLDNPEESLKVNTGNGTVKSYKAKPKSVIKVHPYNRKMSNQKVFESQLNPITGLMEHRYVSIDSIAPNPANVTIKTKNIGDMELQYHTTKKEMRNTLVTMYPAEPHAKYISVRPNIRSRIEKESTTNPGLINIPGCLVRPIKPNTKSVKQQNTAVIPKVSEVIDDQNNNDIEVMPIEPNINFGARTLITIPGPLNKTFKDNSTADNAGVMLIEPNINLGARTLITIPGPLNKTFKDNSTEENAGVMPIEPNINLGARTLITIPGPLNKTSEDNAGVKRVKGRRNTIEIQGNILIQKPAIQLNDGQASASLAGSSHISTKPVFVKPISAPIGSCKNVYIGPKGKLPLPIRKGVTSSQETNPTVNQFIEPIHIQPVVSSIANTSYPRPKKVIVASIVTLGYNTAGTWTTQPAPWAMHPGPNVSTYTTNPNMTVYEPVIPNIPVAPLRPSGGYVNTPEISFEPYTQHEVNVTPESPDAHVGGGTLDYGLPLMNCVGTVLQGTISSPSNLDDTVNSGIDIPLMKCFKTLEHSEEQ